MWSFVAREAMLCCESVCVCVCSRVTACARASVGVLYAQRATRGSVKGSVGIGSEFRLTLGARPVSGWRGSNVHAGPLVCR